MNIQFDKAHTFVDDKLEMMERHLLEIYRRAEKEVGETWRAYLDEIKPEGERLRKAIENATDDNARAKAKKAYQAYLQEKTIYNAHYRELQDLLAQNISNVNRIAAAYINGELPEVYTVNFNQVGQTISEAGLGYSFELVDAQTVKNLATKYDTILPYRYIDGVKDVRWNTKQLNSEILQGILQGETIPQMSKRLENVMGMNEKAATRNARTACTSAENKGRFDGFQRARDSGVDVKKRWKATLDMRTRHAHGVLDGVTVPVDQPFENEFGRIMYPADPDADPANVYNCRCALAGDVGQRRSTTRMARDENGKSVRIDYMSYTEWMEWRMKNGQ